MSVGGPSGKRGRRAVGQNIERIAGDTAAGARVAPSGLTVLVKIVWRALLTRRHIQLRIDHVLERYD